MLKKNMNIRLGGAQKSLDHAVPIPFDFERNIIMGGGYDMHVARTLYKLIFERMYPSNPNAPSTFDMASLTPHLAVSVALNYNRINTTLNANAVEKGIGFKSVSDTVVAEKLKVTGIMSPKEVGIRLGGPKINI